MGSIAPMLSKTYGMQTKQSFLELYDKVDADFEMDKKEDAMYENDEGQN